MLSLIACKSNTEKKTEKYKGKRNNIVNVEDKIVDIKTDVFFGDSYLNIIDDILIVTEKTTSGAKGIHLFNKNTFKYITSTAIIGKGPGEVARSGRMGIDDKNRIFWLPDHGKKLMWKFSLDSVLNNPMYKPTESINLYDDLFLVRFDLLNDSIALGKAVHMINHNNFEMNMAKLNLNTNTTGLFGFEHIETVKKKSNAYFKLSIENNIYVNCYIFSDLMTICDIDGTLKYNVYGPDWLKNMDNKNSYFGGVGFIDKHIIAAYNGSADIIYDKFKRGVGNSPSKFLVFDLKGNYEETIETGYSFNNFCVDEENQRLIVYFEGRENPLGYINLNIN